MGALAMLACLNPTTPAVAAGSALGAATYVALGDSYASGEGLKPYNAWGENTDVKAGKRRNVCHRSPYAYSQREGGKLLPNVPAKDRAFWACSGATSDEMRLPGSSSNQYGQPVQIDTVKGTTTKYITISAGGNDAEFDALAKACISVVLNHESPVPLDSSACAMQLTKSRDLLPEITTKLHNLYGALLDNAPNARVVVVGYPRIFPSDYSQSPTFAGNQFCVINHYPVGGFQTVDIGMSVSASRQVDQFIRDLNNSATAAIAQLKNERPQDSWRLGFADTYADTVPRNCNGTTPNAAVNGFMVSGFNGIGSKKFWEKLRANLTSSASFHPTDEGQAQMLSVVAAEFASLSDTAPLSFTTESTLPVARVGQHYSTVIQAAGGSGAITFGVTDPRGLPEGLNWDGGNGLLEGTPMVAGTYSIPIKARDGSGQTVDRVFALTINPHESPPEPTTWGPVGEAPLPSNASGTWTEPPSKLTCNETTCALGGPYIDNAGRARIGVAIRKDGAWAASQDLGDYDPAAFPHQNLNELACMERSACLAKVGSRWWVLRDLTWESLETPMGLGKDQSSQGEMRCGVNACAAIQYYWDSIREKSVWYFFTYTDSQGLVIEEEPAPTDAVSMNRGSRNPSCGENVCVISGSYSDASGDSQFVLWTWTPAGGWTTQSNTRPNGADPIDNDNYGVSCGSDMCLAIDSGVNAKEVSGIWRWQPQTGWVPELREIPLPSSESTQWAYWRGRSECKGVMCLLELIVFPPSGGSDVVVVGYTVTNGFTPSPPIPGEASDSSPFTTVTSCSRSSCHYVEQTTDSSRATVLGRGTWSPEKGWDMTSWEVPYGYPKGQQVWGNYFLSIFCSDSQCVTSALPRDAQWSIFLSHRWENSPWDWNFVFPSPSYYISPATEGVGACSNTECLIATYSRDMRSGEIWALN